MHRSMTISSVVNNSQSSTIHSRQQFTVINRGSDGQRTTHRPVGFDTSEKPLGAPDTCAYMWTVRHVHAHRHLGMYAVRHVHAYRQLGMYTVRLHTYRPSGTDIQIRAQGVGMMVEDGGYRHVLVAGNSGHDLGLGCGV